MRCFLLTTLLLSPVGLVVAEPSPKDDPGPPMGIIPPDATLPIPPDLTSTIGLPPHTEAASSSLANPSDNQKPLLLPPGDGVSSLSHTGYVSRQRCGWITEYPGMFSWHEEYICYSYETQAQTSPAAPRFAVPLRTLLLLAMLATVVFGGVIPGKLAGEESGVSADENEERPPTALPSATRPPVVTTTAEITKVPTVTATVTKTPAATCTPEAQECVRLCGFVAMDPSVLSQRRMMCWCQTHEDLEAAKLAAQTLVPSSATPGPKTPMTTMLALALLTAAVVGLPGSRDCVVVSPRSTTSLTETAIVERMATPELHGRTSTETRAAKTMTITQTVTIEYTHTTTKTLPAANASTVFVTIQPAPFPTYHPGHGGEEDSASPDIQGWIFGTGEFAGRLIHSLARQGKEAVEDGSSTGATLEKLIDTADKSVQFGLRALAELIKATLPPAADDDGDGEDDEDD